MADATNTGQQPASTLMFERVLVPLDGSEASEAALAYAAQIPCRELVLLHVSVDDDFIVPEWFGEATEDNSEEQDVQTILQNLANAMKTDSRDVTVSVRVGDVAEEIISEGRNADLIVMMTHGRGAAGRLIFGSIADRVIRHGETPTLLLRRGDHTTDPRPPKRIVIALDGSEFAEQSLAPGSKAAKYLGIPVMLVRSVGFDEVRAVLRAQGDKPKTPYELSDDLFDKARVRAIEESHAYLEGHAERLRAEGVDVKVEVIEGPAAFCLQEVLTPDDVAVMTTRGLGGYKRWSIGSVVEKLVRESPCPVLVQRSAKAS